MPDKPRGQTLEESRPHTHTGFYMDQQPNFFESKLFAFGLMLATPAVLALTGYLFYPKYQAQARLEFYAPSTSAIKISEEVKVTTHSNKSASWKLHTPCITLKLSEAGQPITACKAVGFMDSPDQARQFLASRYPGPSGFTVYVSADQRQASLDSYDAARARQALMPMVIIWVLFPVCNFGMWFYLRKKAQRQRS